MKMIKDITEARQILIFNFDNVLEVVPLILLGQLLVIMIWFLDITSWLLVIASWFLASRYNELVSR